MIIEIEHTELSEKVYRIIKKMILERQFSSGQKLDLNELSSQMNISRTPLKDAINRLVSEGLMEVKPRSGTFVTAITTNDIEQVMEIRKMIELWCVKNLTREQASSLSSDLSNILDASQLIIKSKDFQYEYFLQNDIEFHKAIVKTNANKRMFDMYDSLNSFLQVSRVYFFRNFERSVNGQKEHEYIERHIKSYELVKVADMITSHINNSKESMIQIVKENGGVI
jgi:DNA-binding GntR family transcriptional regulator